ncbi:hypothetical protein [Pseudotenacibaculum haliotis]|uniref:Integral membrane protein n=1 Tax=Pseudotenacibaculum haliotis TaxID=1862138 RepID=A0ABW5LV19_9FLAO
MSVFTTKTFFPAFLRTLGLLYLYILIGLFIDSKFMVAYYQESQWIANALMVFIFSIVLWKSTPKMRELMVYAVLIGYGGEYLFSIGFGMYTYRLENVPHYIPMGHALVYLGVLYFIKTTYVKQQRQQLEKIFTVIIIAYATAFLIFKSDVFGFVLTAITLLILRKKPRERLFYLTMYLSIVFLEIAGTSYESWRWPEIAFDYFSFLPSANPPSGISFFYFGLDLGCLWLYKQRHKLAWSRMKNQRKIRLGSTSS